MVPRGLGAGAGRAQVPVTHFILSLTVGTGQSEYPFLSVKKQLIYSFEENSHNFSVTFETYAKTVMQQKFP